MKFINPSTLMTPSSGFSHGVQVDNLLFVAGQVGLNALAKFPDGDRGMEAQTRQAIANIAAVLADAGATLKDIVSATVYIKNLEDYKVFNQVWDECFAGHRPARATVRADMVSTALLVEIQAIAVGPQLGLPTLPGDLQIHQ